jgi:putative transcriptional regulator
MTSLTGSFLVARASLQDPNFARTVVLLLAHTAEGAFGVIVNRPSEVEGLPFPVFEGGPCESPGVILLHGHPDWLLASPGQAPKEPADKEVAPGILIGDESSLKRAGHPVSEKSLRMRLFRGYAGWGPRQLEKELTGGDWAVVAATGFLLFDTPVDELWYRLAPSSIPQPSLN